MSTLGYGNLLAKMSQAAYGTVRDVYGREPDAGNGVSAVVGAVQTFGDMINWHPHAHCVVPEGVFSKSGEFVPLPDAQLRRAEELWREQVFRLSLDAHKIDEATVAKMRGWKHSGFSQAARCGREDLAALQAVEGAPAAGTARPHTVSARARGTRTHVRPGRL
ncbi:MAG: hypothetical protein GF331_15895 [Chitinivibrionales bacterium]|nr:hypothetical protein [Chitinivibrionales bacterium]